MLAHRRPIRIISYVSGHNEIVERETLPGHTLQPSNVVIQARRSRPRHVDGRCEIAGLAPGRSGGAGTERDGAERL